MFVVVFKLYEIKHKTLYFPTKFESPFFLPRMVWFVTLITTLVTVVSDFIPSVVFASVLKLRKHCFFYF